MLSTHKFPENFENFHRDLHDAWTAKNASKPRKPQKPEKLQNTVYVQHYGVCENRESLFCVH